MIDATVSFRPSSCISTEEGNRIEALLNRQEDLHVLLATLEEIHTNGRTPDRLQRIEDAYRAFRLNVGFVY